MHSPVHRFPIVTRDGWEASDLIVAYRDNLALYAEKPMEGGVVKLVRHLGGQRWTVRGRNGEAMLDLSEAGFIFVVSGSAANVGYNGPWG